MRESEPARRSSITVDRIAVVSVVGTLVAGRAISTAASGLVVLRRYRRRNSAAMDDPTVRGVILDVDSPGGEVGGLFDLVEQIRAIKARPASLCGRSPTRVRCPPLMPSRAQRTAST